MSDCERCEEMISALLDGELTEEEEAEVRAHMAGCEQCSAMYEAFAAVGAAVAAQDVPDTLHGGIMAKVRASEKARRTHTKIVRFRSVFAVAACLAVLVGTVFALRSNLGRPKYAASGGSASAKAAAPESMLYSVPGGSSGSTASGSTAAGATASGAAAEEAAPESAEILMNMAADDLAAPEAPAEEAGRVYGDAYEVSAAADSAAAGKRAQDTVSFTMRLESVAADELHGVVTDAGDQVLLAEGDAVKLQHDGAELLSPEIGKELLVTVAADAKVDQGCVPWLMIRSADETE